MALVHYFQGGFIAEGVQFEHGCNSLGGFAGGGGMPVAVIHTCVFVYYGVFVVAANVADAHNNSCFGVWVHNLKSPPFARRLLVTLLPTK